jgi:hypothetical protein
MPGSIRNVLFVGGGRRVELARRFVKQGFHVFAYELNPYVPVSKYATILEGLDWIESYQDIKEYIKENDISLVVPLMDEAVEVCADFDIALLTDKRAARICLYKDMFENEFYVESMKHDNFHLYPFPVIGQPCVAKPKNGHGSLGIEEFVYTKGIEKEYNGAYVFQKKVFGKEYSVDCYFDRRGTWVDSVPRLRERMAGGEVITSTTVENEPLRRLSGAIGMGLHLQGPINMQFIEESGTGINYIIEINARFGGGATLSMQAGLDLIGLIKRDHYGVDLNYKVNSYQRHLTMERSFRDHFFYKGEDE